MTKQAQDAVELVKRVYGDSNGYEARSLSFKSEPITDFGQFATMLRAIGQYNAFDAEAVIEGVKGVWPALMSVQIAREGSPAIYFKLPYWTNQMIGVETYGSESFRLTDGERKQIELELREAIRDLDADEIDLEKNDLRVWWD